MTTGRGSQHDERHEEKGIQRRNILKAGDRAMAKKKGDEKQTVVSQNGAVSRHGKKRESY